EDGIRDRNVTGVQTCALPILADQLGLTRQNVSNHLACLRDCGLVRTSAKGRQVSYELVDASLAHALEDLLSVVWGTTQPHEPVEDRKSVVSGKRAADGGGRSH